jgi:Domain of unknown function (DUF5666)
MRTKQSYYGEKQMKSNKVLLTSLVLGGMFLAACKPGAAVVVNPNSANAAVESGNASATANSGAITLVNTEVQIESTVDDNGVDSQSTGTPGADDGTDVVVAQGTETPGVEDNGTDVVDDNGTDTPGADDNGTDVVDDHGTHTAEPEHTEDATGEGTTVPNLGQSIEFSGTIESVGNGFLVIGGQTVWIGAGTEVKGDLSAGSVVKVEGFIDGNGAISAREIKSGTTAIDGNGSNSGQGSNSGGSDDNGTSQSGVDDGSAHDANDDNGGDQNQGGSTDSGGQSGGSDDGGGHQGGGDNSGHGGGG